MCARQVCLQTWLVKPDHVLDSQPRLATSRPHDLISLITPHSKTTDASVPLGGKERAVEVGEEKTERERGKEKREHGKP